MYNFIKNNFGDNINIKYIIEKESWIKRSLGIEVKSDRIIDDVFTKLEEKIEYNKFKF